MPENQLRSELEFLLEKSVSKRITFQFPEFGAGPVELHQSLVGVQNVLTELEVFLSRAVRAKAALDRKETRLRLSWQVEWDKALLKKKVAFNSTDYVSSKEKVAEANLATFELSRNLRDIQEDLSFGNEAVEVIRLHYYGLDKSRQDIRKRLDMSQTDYYS